MTPSSSSSGTSSSGQHSGRPDSGQPGGGRPRGRHLGGSHAGNEAPASHADSGQPGASPADEATSVTGQLPTRRAKYHHGPSHAGNSAAPRKRNGWVIILVCVLVVALGLGIFAIMHLRAADPGADPASGMSGSSVLDAVHVSGRQGAIPTVTVDGPIDVVDMKFRVLETGTGRQVTEGSPVVVAVTAFDGSNGNVLTTDGRPVYHIGFAEAETLGEDLVSAVIGQSEGSRLVFVRRVATDARAPGAVSDIEIDVVDIMSSVADGEDVEPPQSGPVSVLLSDDGPIAWHEGEDAPTELTTQLLKKGDGPQVRTGDQVVAQFIVTGWNSGQVRTSTWNGGTPQLIDTNTTMEGLKVALVDQRVGSRLVVTIPPELAEGDDTLVAVIDILGTQPGDGEPADQQSSEPESSGQESNKGTQSGPGDTPVSGGQ